MRHRPPMGQMLLVPRRPQGAEGHRQSIVVRIRVRPRRPIMDDAVANRAVVIMQIMLSWISLGWVEFGKEVLSNLYCFCGEWGHFLF
jgi:hypothetical protein